MVLFLARARAAVCRACVCVNASLSRAKGASSLAQRSRPSVLVAAPLLVLRAALPRLRAASS